MKYKKEYEVRISDINPGQHFSHDKILLIMHDARCDFFKNLKLPTCDSLIQNDLCLIEKNIDGENKGIILTELNIKYLSEIFYPDILEVNISISNQTKISFNMNYKINNKNKNAIEAQTKLVCYDYKNKKISSFSDLFIKKINNYL